MVTPVTPACRDIRDTLAPLETLESRATRACRETQALSDLTDRRDLTASPVCPGVSESLEEVDKMAHLDLEDSMAFLVWMYVSV